MANNQARGWAVFDRRRQYIPVSYPTEERALEERRQLLKYFEPDSCWHRRLNVQMVGVQPLVQPGDPPYGYRYRHGRHGIQLFAHQTEQKIIKMVEVMLQGGDYPYRIAQRLNAGGYRNRDGGRFTTLQLNQLVDALVRKQPKPKQKPVVYDDEEMDAAASA